MSNPLKGVQHPKTVKHIVTDEDLKNNPELVEQGIQVGDEIEIPAPAEKEKNKRGRKPQNK